MRIVAGYAADAGIGAVEAAAVGELGRAGSGRSSRRASGFDGDHEVPGAMTLAAEIGEALSAERSPRSGGIGDNFFTEIAVR